MLRVHSVCRGRTVVCLLALPELGRSRNQAGASGQPRGTWGRSEHDVTQAQTDIGPSCHKAKGLQVKGVRVSTFSSHKCTPHLLGEEMGGHYSPISSSHKSHMAESLRLVGGSDKDQHLFHHTAALSHVCLPLYISPWTQHSLQAVQNPQAAPHLPAPGLSYSYQERFSGTNFSPN